MSPKTKLLKLALFVLLPPLVMLAASAVFDAATVRKVMIYGGPLALLPLVIRWARRRADERAERVL